MNSECLERVHQFCTIPTKSPVIIFVQRLFLSGLLLDGI